MSRRRRDSHHKLQRRRVLRRKPQMEIRALMNEKKRAVECVDNDETASQIACLVNAKRLLILTSVNGIYTDISDENSLVREINGKNTEELLKISKSTESSATARPERAQTERARSWNTSKPPSKRHGSHHCQQQVFNPRYSGRKRPRNPHKSKITIQNAAIKRRLCN